MDIWLIWQVDVNIEWLFSSVFTSNHFFMRYFVCVYTVYIYVYIIYEVYMFLPSSVELTTWLKPVFVPSFWYLSLLSKVKSFQYDFSVSLP